MTRITFSFVIILGTWVSTASAAQLFFTDHWSGTIRRHDLNSSTLNVVIPAMNPNPPGDYNQVAIEIDEVGRKMYWVDGRSHEVRRANLDGTSPQVVNTRTGADYGPIDLDLYQGQIFWTDPGLDLIRSSNLDGTNAHTVISGLDDPTAIAIDAVHGAMFWSDNTHTIRRANLNGSGITTVISTNTFGISDITIDAQSEKIYWAASRAIRRANLDGTQPELLFHDPNRNFYALALDDSAGKIYWSDILSTSRVGRMNVNGSSRETIISSAQIDPSSIRGIAIFIPEPSPIVLFFLGQFLIVLNYAPRRIQLHQRRADD